jgi:hypothetical protein
VPLEENAATPARDAHLTTIYCVVPVAEEDELLAPLLAHYAGRPDVEVIVDRRGGRRRAAPDLRLPDNLAALERREAGNRRRPMLPRQLAGELPQALAERAGAVRWQQRLAPVQRGLQDADLGELLSLIADGHDGAMSELYWRHLVRVGSRLAQRVGRHQVAHATREAFGRLFDRLSEYRAERSFEVFLDAHVDAVARDVRRAGA